MSAVVNVAVVPDKAPAKVTPVVPVGIEITSASASFLIVTSFVEPWPVKINPSAEELNLAMDKIKEETE